jgi:hypothetical protein
MKLEHRDESLFTFPGVPAVVGLLQPQATLCNREIDRNKGNQIEVALFLIIEDRGVSSVAGGCL